jgi:hypothetical protein
LVMVALRQAPATVLGRYMGDDGYRAFTDAAARAGQRVA